MKLFIMMTLSLVLGSCGHRKKAETTTIPGSLEEAIASHFRDPLNSERDEFQHPKETLQFFGLSSSMTVVEISPGAGYFAEILAPYLAKEGQYVMAVPRLPPNPPHFLIENEKKIQDILLGNPEIMKKTKLIPFEPIDERNRIKKDFADLVVSFNSVHNWVAKDSAPESFQFFFDILKPGGTLGIVQHRQARGKKKIPMSGYMTEKEVIQLAKSAGFKLVARSEINANPKDTTDYPGGVWVLPPVYRLGEKDKKRFEEIGESNRMTLKFIKP